MEFTMSTTIETPRLLLQDLSVEEHAEALHEIYSNVLTMKFMPTLVTKSLEETKSTLRKELRSPDKPWLRMFAILLRPEGDEKPRIIGKIGVSPNMAWYIHPDYWGKGYATEAGKACLDFYWTIPELRHNQKITAYIDTENVPSKKLANRLGFSEGETYRKLSGVGEATTFNIFRGAMTSNFTTKRTFLEGFPIITDRLWMQRLSIDNHLEGYREIWMNRENTKLLQWDSKDGGIQASLEYMKDRVRSDQNPYVETFAILGPPTPISAPPTGLRCMGTIGMHRFPSTFTAENPEPGEAEVGYGFHADFWGKGYATEALKAFLVYYWQIKEAPHANVMSIVAVHGSNNPGSRRVLEKAGFEFVGVDEELSFMRDGEKIEVRRMRLHRPGLRA